MKGSLTGTYFHNVDEKGRMAVPSKMRIELGEPFYVTAMTKECLVVRSEPEWEKFSEGLHNVPQTDVRAQRMVRKIFSMACKCEPDKQGRVLLPQMLREHVGIEKEVVMIGVSNRAEIWAKDKWQDFMDDMPEDDGDALASLAEYGI